MNNMKPIWKIFSAYILILFFMLISNNAFGQKICKQNVCVVEFNAGWNESNSVGYLDSLTDCGIKRVSIDKGDWQKEYGIVVVPTIISMWFMLQADIADAKELPAPPDPEVTRMEFDMKDQMIRQTIITTQEDVQEIKKSIEKIEDKLYE